MPKGFTPKDAGWRERVAASFARQVSSCEPWGSG